MTRSGKLVSSLGHVSGKAGMSMASTRNLALRGSTRAYCLQHGRMCPKAISPIGHQGGSLL